MAGKLGASADAAGGSKSQKMVTLRVFRYTPSRDSAPRFQTYHVPMLGGMTVLDALMYIKRHLDRSLSMRHSCRMAACGSCGMKINGVAALACYTQLSELKGNVVKVEPLDNYPIVKDLAVDFGDFFKQHHRIRPFIIREDKSEQHDPTVEYRQTKEDIEKFLQFSYCIRCGLCTSACPTIATDRLFPGPQALAQAYRYIVDSRDEGALARLQVIDNPHGVWRCHFAGSCSAVCPKGVDPALGIQLLRRITLKRGSAIREVAAHAGATKPASVRLR